MYSLNLLLSEGLFPDELKITNVAPMYKAEDSTRLNNYKIVLCVLSKVKKKSFMLDNYHFSNLKNTVSLHI